MARRPRWTVWRWDFSNLCVYPLFVAVAAWGLAGIYLVAAVVGRAGSRSLSALWAVLSLAVAVATTRPIWLWLNRPMECP